ncbi:MAG TPA: hypothetical protein VIW24_08740 [Aldersonia sp.]
MHLVLDGATRPAALTQIRSIDATIAKDIALHVDLWLTRKRDQSLRWIRAAGGHEITIDDIDLVAELLTDAAAR